MIIHVMLKLLQVKELSWQQLEAINQVESAEIEKLKAEVHSLENQLTEKTKVG